MIRNRFFVLVLGLMVCTSPKAEEGFQTLDSIYSFVKKTIETSMSASDDFEINVLPLDTQLKLRECSQPLDAVNTNNLIKAGRVSIGVHCRGDKKWTIFVSAIIKVYESVIVLTRPIRRGEIIARQDLTIERKDVSTARGDFVTQFEQIENKEATRNLSSGTVLGMKSVLVPPLIKRKDKVIISAGETGISVQMSGTALMDGTKGQVIKVKNETSGRIVSGMVIEPGLVLVK